MGQIDASCKTPVSNPFAINPPSAYAIVNPAGDTQPVTNFDIHPPARKGESIGMRGRKGSDGIDSLLWMCGGGVFDLSPSLPPPPRGVPRAPLAASRKQASRGRAGLDRIGREGVRLTLVARGCQPPTHATTKLPLKGDPAMAAGLVVFRFRGELSPFPSTFSIPSLSPCFSDLANRKGMVAEGDV